jgi:hypothetical protein
MVEQTADVFPTLLVHGNVIRQSDLAEATSIAKDLSIPLNKALVMSGVTSEDQISLVLEAKSLIEKKEISLDLAIRGLRVAVHEKCDLQTALATLAKRHIATQQVVSFTNDLTSLFVDSKIIDANQLAKALQHANETKMLIGHTLLLTGAISAQTLAAGLHGVLMMRQKLLDKEKVVQGLEHAWKKEITIEHALFELSLFVAPRAETMRVSELALMAGLLTPSDLVECLEIELFKNKQFGQVLLEQGLISQPQLDSAVELQGAVANETIKPYQAAAALKRVCKDNVNLYQAMAEVQTAGLADVEFRLGELLVEAGICTQEEIDKIVDQNQNTNIKIGKALLAAGVVKGSMLYSVLRCQSLFRQGYVSARQAIASLVHCRENSKSFDETLSELNYYPPARMQWLWV